MNEEYTISLATEEETKTLPGYRYSQLNDTATCPTLGALTYGFIPEGQNPSEDPNAIRSMALDAGSACHEVFAAVRLWELRDREPLFTREAERLFNERWEELLVAMTKKKADGERMAKMAFCLEALYTSGFYDDPYDKNRTLANLEQVCAMYIDRWDSERKLWIAPDQSRAGIELPFNLTLRCNDGWAVRFIGKIDGLHESIDGSGNLVVHENKTGRYINDAWATTFKMSHQVTGYCVAASAVTGKTVRQALVFGTQIPLNTSCPVRLEPVVREDHHIKQWAVWFRAMVAMYEDAKQDPVNALKFSHSCGRFFGQCKFMPFCHGDDDEKNLILTRLKEGTE